MYSDIHVMNREVRSFDTGNECTTLFSIVLEIIFNEKCFRNPILLSYCFQCLENIFWISEGVRRINWLWYIAILWVRCQEKPQNSVVSNICPQKTTVIISAFGNFLIVETKVLPLTIPTLTLNVITMENTDLIVAGTITHLYLKQEN